MEGLGLSAAGGAPPALRAGRLRRFLGGLTLVAASSGVGLLLAELAVRFVALQPLPYVTPGLYEPAPPPLRFRLAAGYRGRVRNGVEFDTAVAIDARGMRTTAPAADPVAGGVGRGRPLPPGEGRGEGPLVVVVGDSFTFGWGVEAGDTFVARLDRSLPVRVANGGVPGTGMPDYDAWLATTGLGLAPQIVVVAVFLGNDLLDATAAHRSIAIENGLVAGAPRARGLRAWLDDRSHLLRLARRALPLATSRAVRSWLGLGEPWAESYLRDTFGSFASEPPPLVAEGRAATAEAFGRLVERARPAGASVAMVLIPGALEVDAQRWQAALRQLGKDGEAYDPGVPARFFSDLGARHGVPVLDLTPAIAAAAPDPARYFRYDPHWTAAGHALAAAAIRPFLEDLLNPTPRTP